ncbi:MAG: hypothetical protein WA447_09400 [Candidatus Binatus sp.]
MNRMVVNLRRVAKKTIKVEAYTCERCGYEWIRRFPDKPEPRTCPKCKSPYWDRPRRKH